MAFRWTWDDQRRRCPACLRRLSESASIGRYSYSLLDWCGTETFCARGHGLLHVPETANSYSGTRWLDVDRSWRVLFS